MHHRWVSLGELCLRVLRRTRGVGRYRRELEAYFPDGSVDAAELQCAAINRDVRGYMEPFEPAELPEVTETPRGPDLVLRFASPKPAQPDDDVRVRLWSSPTAAGDRVVVFHHAVFQSSWAAHRWFVAPLLRHVPVALMAAPFHFDRTPAGEFPGERYTNPNPVDLYAAIAQWISEERMLRRVLAARGTPAVAVIGFSLGAFQSLLSAAFGWLDLPIVSLACTNRYAWGIQHGPAARFVVRAMREAGIDGPRLERMVDGMQLERYVPGRIARPVLHVVGDHDNVDPPPSLARLEAALRPTRSVHLPAGHGTLVLYRKRICAEVVGFLRETGALDSSA